MNEHLQSILNFIEQDNSLSADKKDIIANALKDADKELVLTAFKLDRTEKVKRTTAILLEETIAELEQKRKAVEAQNRELEIEGALERVRARAMAMFSSEEIADVARIMRNELGHLNIEGLFAATIYLQQNDGSVRLWDITIADTLLVNGPKSSWDMKVRVDELHPRLFITRIWKSTEKYFVLKQDEQDFPILIDWVKQFKKEDAEEIERTIKENNIKHTWFAGVPLEHGRLSIELHGPPPIEVESILRKMGSTFDLAYTRFLDLQKAEAQAKEAQIELGLERVRASAMAMHGSDELKEVITVLSDQLQQLNIKFDNVSFGINTRDYDINFWMAAKGQPYPLRIHAPYIDNPIVIRVKEAQQNGVNFFTDTLTHEENAQWLRHMFDNAGVTVSSEETKNYLLNSAGYSRSTVIMKDINFFIGNYAVQPYTEEENEIIRRFANVFEQSYTRFLDLEKAEAQAREAQIELGLERVRSRAMAMHNSTELSEVVQVMFENLWQMDFVFDDGAVNILVFKEGSKDHVQWSADSTQAYVKAFEVDYTDHVISASLLQARESGVDFFSHIFPVEEKNEYFQFLFEHTNHRDLPDEVKKLILESKDYGYSVAFAKKSAIMIPTNSGRLVPEDKKEILKRFANVFDQAFIRFLDLQKSEAQAREAQIELGLERVRARAMAMHKSDELAETAYLLFDQLKELGEAPDRAFIAIVNEEEHVLELWTTQHGGKQLNMMVKVSIHEPLVMDKIYAAWKQQKKTLIIDLQGEELESYFHFMKEVGVPVDRAKFGVRRIDYVGCFSKGAIGIITQEPRPAEILQLIERFAGVFDLTYTRFLDLQNAEAQAREAQIEASLERVRSKTMAMQNSEDVTSATETMFDELKRLGIDNLRCGIANIHHDKTFDVFGVTNLGHGNTMSGFGLFGMDEHPIWQRWFESWNNKEEVFNAYIAGQEKEEYFNNINNHRKYLPQAIDHFPDSFFQAYLFEQGSVWTYSLLQHGQQEKEIMKRFATGFSLTFRRYQDLKKAEAQAREAQIEAALEKIRSRSLAMHHSREIPEVIATMFEKLRELKAVHNTVAIQFFDFKTKDSIFWVGNNLQEVAPKVLLPFDQEMMEADTCHRDLWKAMETGEVIFNKVYTKQQKDQWFDYVFAHADSTVLEEQQKDFIRKAEIHTVCFIPVKNAGLFASSWDGPKYTEENLDVLTRVARVFDQAYTRFLDLQKAEAQAREAQIEAALEKIRSRSLAMIHSGELRDVIQMVYEQLILLNIKLDSASFILDYKESEDMNMWTGVPGSPYPRLFQIPYLDHPMFNRISEAKQKQIHFIADSYAFEEKKVFWQHFFKHAPWVPEERQKYIFSSPGLARSQVLMDTISLMIMNYDGTPYSEADNQTIKRFAAAFQQTYTRFSDLQKAEAQAREAQIETALEKVRSRSLAMHKSDELQEVISTVMNRLNELGVAMDTAFVCLASEDKTGFEIWIASNDYKYSENLRVHFGLNTAIMNDIENFFRSKNVFFSRQYSKEEKDEHYKSLFEHSSFSHISQERKHFLFSCEHYGISMAQGKFSLIQTISYSGKTLNELEAEILKRFSRVFEQAYTRFLDLQKAEAQAREATKQASLDRVRGVIASMRSAADLELITPLIFKELTILGVPFIRCGVFIVDEKKELVNVYLSSPKGNSLGVLKLPYNAYDLTRGTVEAWRKGLVYRQHWNKDDFVRWINQMMEQDQIQDSIAYQGAAAPPESLDLHFVPFTQGMLYVGATHPLIEKEIEIVQALAKAFSLAYARYEDFEKLEQAKVEIELSMADLKATQSQLIQSEKMASLGQLTAGIAHEIQNPLNFINNFSDVNTELIEELKHEADNGNIGDVKSIANDIKENEQKINHHGKRADAIVKGMLQHSRTSTGEKELIDINVLADEYLRLAYQGQRTKDKSFDVKIETEFAVSIGKVNVIQQGIGRVLLNLYNNAFYAVNEKKKLSDKWFEPTVIITTKKATEEIEISVKDNGNGIPQNILDKIFQPFFTTKPTGQGTGLGLSLSYDIIKAHGGELKVETKEGEGTSFIIVLPII